MATVSREASKQNATASPNTGFAAHYVRQNALHFAKPETDVRTFAERSPQRWRRGHTH